jgi:hypothetical protein
MISVSAPVQHSQTHNRPLCSFVPFFNTMFKNIEENDEVSTHLVINCYLFVKGHYIIVKNKVILLYISIYCAISYIVNNHVNLLDKSVIIVKT